jgi:hypothetical protein
MDVAPFFGSLLVIEQTREPVVKVHEQSQFDFDMGWGYGPCVDGSGLARTFFTPTALVGAAMCSAFECGTPGRWP